MLWTIITKPGYSSGYYTLNIDRYYQGVTTNNQQWQLSFYLCGQCRCTLPGCIRAVNCAHVRSVQELLHKGIGILRDLSGCTARGGRTDVNNIYKVIYLSIYLSNYPSNYPSIHLSISPSIYLSIFLSTYPSIHYQSISRGLENDRQYFQERTQISLM